MGGCGCKFRPVGVPPDDVEKGSREPLRQDRMTKFISVEVQTEEIKKGSQESLQQAGRKECIFDGVPPDDVEKGSQESLQQKRMKKSIAVGANTEELKQGSQEPLQQEGTDESRSAIVPPSPIKKSNSEPAQQEGAASAPRKCIVISYSTKQTDFMKDVKHKLEKVYGFQAWSGADVNGGQNWLNQWLDKVKDPNTVAVVFILSKSFTHSPACQKELQYVTQNLEGKLGIMPVMYEEFPMPDELIFLLTTVNYVTAEPVAKTKCKCEKKCECSDPALLEREKPVSDEWFSSRFRSGLIAALRGYVPDLELEKLGTNTDAETLTPQRIKQLHVHMEHAMCAHMFKESQEAAAQEETAKEGTKKKKVSMKRRGSKMSSAQKKKRDSLAGFVVIHGSTEFNNRHSEEICKEIGRQLAMLERRIAIVSGGFVGVGDTTCKSFCMMRKDLGRPEDTFMILPETDPDIEGKLAGKANTTADSYGTKKFAPWDYGQTLFYGRSNAERLDIMGSIGTCILVEGGPGAAKAAQMEQKAGFVVIPVRCTGGIAANTALFNDSPFDLLPQADEAQKSWDLLQQGTVQNPAEVAAAVVKVISACHDMAGGQHEANQLPDIPQSIDNRPDGLQELPDFSSFCSYLKQFKAVVLFNGHGSTGQYGNMKEVEEIVDLVVCDLNARFGKDEWLVLYGGEPYEENVHTISHPVRRLYTKHGKKVCAVQCDEYGDYVKRPSRKTQFEHLTGGALYEYPTKRHFDRRARKENIQFGGYDQHGSLIGGSAVWYDERVRALGYPTCHVLIGGGPIASDEADISVKKDVPIFYARTKKKFQSPLVVRQNPADAYGQLEHWANENGIPRDRWHPFAWQVS